MANVEQNIANTSSYKIDIEGVNEFLIQIVTPPAVGLTKFSVGRGNKLPKIHYAGDKVIEDFSFQIIQTLGNGATTIEDWQESRVKRNVRIRYMNSDQTESSVGWDLTGVFPVNIESAELNRNSDPEPSMSTITCSVDDVRKVG